MVGVKVAGVGTWEAPATPPRLGEKVVIVMYVYGLMRCPKCGSWEWKHLRYYRICKRCGFVTVARRKTINIKEPTATLDTFFKQTTKAG